MRTIRNVAFVMFCLLVALAQRTTVGAFYDWCPEQCDCTIDSGNQGHVTATCNYAVGCGDGAQACSTYCYYQLPEDVWEQYQLSVTCWPSHYECVDPLEPPTEWDCQCLCW